MKLIFDGDSWTFGSEIVDPKLAAQYNDDVHPGAYDHLQDNDWYRVPKLYAHKMAELLDCDYVNLSCPADDNKTILDRTMAYIAGEYISQNKPTDELFVIIGWSSPERNSFWWTELESDEPPYRFRLLPHNGHTLKDRELKLWEMYVEHLWNPEEYITRHVSTVLAFQNFCKAHNIKWLCYNAFYQLPTVLDTRPSSWADLDMNTQLNNVDLCGYTYSQNGQRCGRKLEFNSLWDTVDPVRFYKKNQQNNTFKSFMTANLDDPWVGWHPNSDAHSIWARELVEYIHSHQLYT